MESFIVVKRLQPHLYFFLVADPAFKFIKKSQQKRLELLDSKEKSSNEIFESDSQKTEKEEDGDQIKKRMKLFKVKKPKSDIKIIGLEKQQENIISSILGPQLFPEHQSLFDGDLIRNTFLLYGCPGNGKSILAEHMAYQCEMNIMKVSGSLVMSKYIGDTSKNLTAIFQKALENQPCIIFIGNVYTVSIFKCEHCSSSFLNFCHCCPLARFNV